MKKITLREGDIFFTAWEQMNLRKRYRLMLLLPFLDDPYARLLALREIAKSKEIYLQLQRATNSAELIVDLFHNGFTWLSAAPKSFAFAEIRAKDWIFTAPDYRLPEGTFGQLVEMDSAFTKYLRTQQESHFDNLLAELYSVKQEGGKSSKLAALAQVPYPYRIDAFRVYSQIRDKVFLSFPNLFPKVDKPSEKTEAKPLDFRKVRDSTPMWHSLLFSLAETPAYQGMHTAKAANMWEALTYLDEKAFEIQKAKEKT